MAKHTITRENNHQAKGASFAVHRHFRLSPHPVHHGLYHLLLLIAILVLVLVGMNAFMIYSQLADTPGQAKSDGASTLQEPPSPTLDRTVYQQQVRQALGDSLTQWEISEVNRQEITRIRTSLMDMRVPREFLEAHLGVVLLLSKKEEAISSALAGDNKQLVGAQEDENAFLEQYSWLKL